MNKLSHVDSQGRARMVDVGDKEVQRRTAGASGFITLSGETLKLIHENAMKKGDVLVTAEIAGVQAAKKTSELIPLCHNIALDHVQVSAIVEEGGIGIYAIIRCTGKTGAEMEALTAVSVGLLTIYDMCKAVDKNMEIGRVRLVKKQKTGIFV